MLMDLALLSGKYYIVREIADVPLIELCFLLVLVCWILSNLRIASNRISNIKLISGILNRIERYSTDSIRGRRLLGIIIVSLVSYLYLLTFVVWGYVPPDDVKAHTGNFGQSNVPWYLYPMKFGLTGLLGLAFVLSYLFKKFEKEIFIFALIATIALLIGPYYDEHRFGKYIMASMAAFAALLLYKIICYLLWTSKVKSRLRVLFTSFLLGSVITASGFSIFMFAGYNALATENPQFGIALTKRDFPFPSEMQMLEYLHGKFTNSKTFFNIAVPEKEVDINGGLITKIEGFSAVPRAKLLQSPLTLNSSTLEGFYNLLEYTDTRYIVLPKKDFINLGNSTQKTNTLSSSNNNLVLQFALENFLRSYEDENYVVLEVPPFTSPSSSSSSEINGDVALIYTRDDEESFSPFLISNSSNNTDQITILSFDLWPDANNNVSSTAVNYKEYNNGSKGLHSSYEPKLNEYKGMKTRQGTSFITLDDRYNISSNKNSSSSLQGEGMTLWSNPIDEEGLQKYNKIDSNYNSHNGESKQIIANRNNTIYVDTSFRVLDNSYTITNTSNNSHDRKIIKQQHHDYNAGIVFEYGSNSYEISMRKNGLELLLHPEEQPKTITQLCNETAEKSKNKQEQISSSTSLLSQNQEIKREKGIWYRIKLIVFNDTINVFVNDILSAQAQVPTITGEHTSYSRVHPNNNDTKQNICFSDYIYPSISKVGIRTFHSLAEFGPITTGTIPESEFDHVKQKVYKNHYYPLTMLALSGIKKYDTFMEGDLSAFSRKSVILPLPMGPSSFDEYYSNKDNTEDWSHQQHIGKYLGFAKEGGTLVIMDTSNNGNNHDNDFEGAFSEVLGIKLGRLIKFNSIADVSSHSTIPAANYIIKNITGVAREIIITNSTVTHDNGITVKSYYINNNKAETGNTKHNDKYSQGNIAKVPFSLEKKYGKGKIIFVNSGGYFDAIFQKSLARSIAVNKPHYSDGNHLTTLANISHMIGIERQIEKGSNNDSKRPTVSSPFTIIGDLKISGHHTTSTIINSSSVLIPSPMEGKEGQSDSYNNHYHLLVKDITITPQLPLSPFAPTASNDDKPLPSPSPYVPSSTNNLNTSNSSQNSSFKNVLIKDLELYGKYKVTINSTGRAPSYMPESSSYYDYIGIPIPSGFDMTVKLYGNRSYVQLITNPDEDNRAANVTRLHIGEVNGHNSSSNNNSYLLGQQQRPGPAIRISNNNDNSSVTQIQFHKIQVKADSPDIKSIPILMKTPEIKISNAEGVSFRAGSHRNSVTEIKETEGGAVATEAKLNFVDHYHQGYRNGIRTQFITYLKEDIKDTVTSSSGLAKDQKFFEFIKIPGDISEGAKEKGIVHIPWQKAMSSVMGVLIAVTIIGTGVLVFFWKLSPKIKLK
jgi:hypothetical protein